MFFLLCRISWKNLSVYISIVLQTGKIAETSEERREQNSLMNSVQEAMQFLQDAAYSGELDVSLGNKRLHVEYVKFDEEEPMFVCEAGTVAQGNICRKYSSYSFANCNVFIVSRWEMTHGRL